MKNVFRLGAVALVFALIAGPAMARDVTVGQFLQDVAQSRSLSATDARTAVASLNTVGVRLPADLNLNARLTEGDVARISRAMGMRVSTSSPNTPFSEEQVDRYLSSFAADLALVGPGEQATTNECTHPSGDCTNPGEGSGPGNGNGGPPFDPFSKGKGKGKGKAKGNMTPTEPE